MLKKPQGKFDSNLHINNHETIESNLIVFNAIMQLRL